jgi:hypothetical protein
MPWLLVSPSDSATDLVQCNSNPIDSVIDSYADRAALTAVDSVASFYVIC